jgi:hypothetical protein
MTLSLPIQLWRPGLAPGVYEDRPVRSGAALARLDRAAFIGLAERGPLHTAVDVADWASFQRLFGEAVPGLLLPEAVRLFFAQGGRRCLVVRCLNHAASRTRPLGLPGLAVVPSLSPAGARAPLAARNPGGWASGLRLRLTLQQTSISLRRFSESGSGLVCASGSLRVGDSLRLLVSRPDTSAGATAPPPVLVRVVGLEAAGESRELAEGQELVTLQPAPEGPLLAPGVLREARRLELTLEIWLNGRLVERWPQAALHPEHPRFLPRLLGRRAASEQFRPPRTSSGDTESPRAEADRLWGGLQEPWGSEFVRPAVWLRDRSLCPSIALLERGEAWAPRLEENEQEPWDRPWSTVADPDGAEAFLRDHFFDDTEAGIPVWASMPAADQDDRLLEFGERPGPFRAGGALQRWDEAHPLDPAALICLPDLLHPAPPELHEHPPASPPPSRCFNSTCEPPIPDSTTAVRRFAGLGFDGLELLQSQKRLVEACEQRQQGIALLDLPLRQSSVRLPGNSDPLDDSQRRRLGERLEPLRAAERAAWVAGLRSERAALYAPWLRSDSGGTAVTIGPAAVAAGLIGRMEVELGVWRAPANLPARAVFAAAENVGEDLAGALHEERINAFRSTPAGLTLLGSRTTSADPSWTHLSVRRLIDWLKLQIAAELAWAPFEPNGPALWDAMAGTARRRLRQVFDAGGLAGATEAESFFVRCDASTCSAAEREAGRAVLLAGVAAARPAEFLVFELVRRGGEDPGLEVR